MPLPIYYEIHINVPAMDAATQWEGFARFAEDLELRASRFDVDHVDDADGQWFLSGRAATEHAAKRLVRNSVAALGALKIKVLRWKIEAAIWDSKNGHTMEDIT